MSANARVVPVTLVRNKSVEDFNEQVIGLLDEVERRVEQLRYLSLSFCDKKKHRGKTASDKFIALSAAMSTENARNFRHSFCQQRLLIG